MDKILEKFSPLSEDLRLAYLDAMQVPVWIPRGSIKAEGEQEIRVEESLEEKELKESELEKSKLDVLELETSELEESKVEKKPTSPLSSQYLKMVNWKQDSSADKKLLIICRHQKDQPAQSFATANSPSQFMRDYLQAINEQLARTNQLSVQTDLGHLAQAGLSDDSQPMGNLIRQIEPDLILLLGDEGIKPLLNLDSNVADVRGKFHTLQDKHLLVSYHPYSLIQDPQLKKLALQDLVLVVKFFENN